MRNKGSISKWSECDWLGLRLAYRVTLVHRINGIDLIRVLYDLLQGISEGLTAGGAMFLGIGTAGRQAIKKPDLMSPA